MRIKYFLISFFCLVTVSVCQAAEEIKTPSDEPLSNTVTQSVLKQSSQLNPADSVLPMLGGLLAILLLIFILAAILKRFTGFNMAAGNIKIIDRQSLGAKEKLIIVEVQNKQYLLGVTPQQINQICQLEQPISTAAKGPSFDHLMKQFLMPSDKNKQVINSNGKVSDKGEYASRSES